MHVNIEQSFTTTTLTINDINDSKICGSTITISMISL